jgi:hypothetical protein
VAALAALNGSLRVCNVSGGVRQLHGAPGLERALFQVASQFNMLEMMGPRDMPELGVTRYQEDHTQGPACAMAAGAATIYRNYFVPVGDGAGRTRERQLNSLADMAQTLRSEPGGPRRRSGQCKTAMRWRAAKA